ncbi:MAG TPA: hypothetical protein VND19_04690 [Acetobacteraceae bacterium]|nr:hypothetical protein [Acetobacteraceae bacterium]
MCPLTPEQMAEVEKAWAANRAFQAELARKHRMETGKLEIELERGDDDPQEHTPAYQVELEKFKRPLNEAGIRYSQRAIAFDSVDAHGYPLGEFALEFIKTVAPVVSAALVAWITAKYGRKVCVKFMDIEVQARSVEEVGRLIDKVVEVQEKRINTDQGK